MEDGGWRTVEGGRRKEEVCGLMNKEGDLFGEAGGRWRRDGGRVEAVVHEEKQVAQFVMLFVVNCRLFCHSVVVTILRCLVPCCFIVYGVGSLVVVGDNSACVRVGRCRVGRCLLCSLNAERLQEARLLQCVKQREEVRQY